MFVMALLEFSPIAEASYYSKNKYNRKFEREFLDSRGFTIAFWVLGKEVYAYYMGRYYTGTMLIPLEVIDIVMYIKEQCSDPYKVKELAEDIDSD